MCTSQVVALNNVFQLRTGHSLLYEAGLPPFADDAAWFHSNCDGAKSASISQIDYNIII